MRLLSRRASALVGALASPPMPAGQGHGHDPDGPEGGAPPKLSFGQRLLLVLPRVRRDRERNEKKEPVSDWARRTFLKPEDPDKVRKQAPAKSQSVEELEALVKSIDDKERAIGLVAAPVGDRHRVPRDPRARRRTTLRST